MSLLQAWNTTPLSNIHFINYSRVRWEIPMQRIPMASFRHVFVLSFFLNLLMANAYYSNITTVIGCVIMTVIPMEKQWAFPKVSNKTLTCNQHVQDRRISRQNIFLAPISILVLIFHPRQLPHSKRILYVEIWAVKSWHDSSLNLSSFQWNICSKKKHKHAKYRSTTLCTGEYVFHLGAILK